ncbi:TNFAIP3-interacting protein 3 isoform X2 [Syngnathoides biaculeatus]|uniref:TNFAIP3-interacting protein 3 isoform X2 n=1 Tax=Syngnathoides biaculeatus TaxID=300417 RepID=UPI002ADDB252|nr:TNFAIP3-interacting protein 3 isoform X2 [Syngnathoides biaculeatus]
MVSPFDTILHKNFNGSADLQSASMEEHISESMSITSADQEKVQLLNNNTELRAVNKKLMKLNEDWDQTYRNATLGFQRRLDSLEGENATLKDLNTKLLLKVENQQSAKDYYEQAFMLELKKNQELEEYVRLLEGRKYQPPVEKQDRVCETIPDLSSSSSPSSCVAAASSTLDAEPQTKPPSSDSHREIQELKKQLKAIRCQTEIYEAEYRAEHNNHKSTLQDNQRLRRKREDLRQQVALLQEQLKVYEDDFRRERSDKQMLQRLLLEKTAPNKDPVLVHRCNNAPQPQEGDVWTRTAAKKQHHPLCPKHPKRGND